MANKNGYLARMQARKEAEIRFNRKFTMQWCADAAVIAANEVFQRKGKKLVQFLEAFFRYSQWIAEMTLDDAKDDKHIDYTKGKVDACLRELLGEDFQPWEERYDFL